MVGYIKYCGKVIQVTVLENRDGYKIVQTENNEILGIPPESGTRIWNTREECEYEDHCLDWVPMGE